MSPYTRFPHGASREGGAHDKSRDRHGVEAEWRLSDIPKGDLPRHEGTTPTDRQMVRAKTENRQSLTEALRTARLERAGRFTKPFVGRNR